MIVKSSLEALVSSVHSVHISAELWLHICTILSSRPRLTGLQTAKVAIIQFWRRRGKSLRRNMYFYFEYYHWQSIFEQGLILSLCNGRTLGFIGLLSQPKMWSSQDSSWPANSNIILYMEFTHHVSASKVKKISETKPNTYSLTPIRLHRLYD